MAYTAKDWVTGETIDEDELDRIEAGLENIHTRADAHMDDTDLHLSSDERAAIDNTTTPLTISNPLISEVDLGAANRVATLGADSKLTSSQVPDTLAAIIDAGSGYIHKLGLVMLQMMRKLNVTKWESQME
jgi:hypothetical protein